MDDPRSQKYYLLLVQTTYFVQTIYIHTDFLVLVWMTLYTEDLSLCVCLSVFMFLPRTDLLSP